MTSLSQPEISPAAPSIQASGEKLSGMNVNNLGVYLDGWADLVEGRGDKATEVKQLVYQYLLERHMPDVNVEQVNGSVGIGTQKRPYNITATHPSATTAIYVGGHGHDMYVSWRTFIKPQLSWVVGLCMVLGLLAGGYVGFSSYNFSSGAFFIPDSASILGALTFGLIVSAFVFGLFISFFAFLGVTIKGDYRSYFFIEPNIFDAEDITAMGLSAHKSLLRALDVTGIDVKNLRLKQNFKGGRKNEDI